MPARRVWVWLALVVWVGVVASAVPAQTDLLDPQAVYDRAAPAVSLVRAITDGRTAIGTAFTIDRDGLLLTAAHVARRAEGLTVEYPGGRALSATVVGYDARRDLALLRVSTPTPLPSLEVAAGGVRPGEPVVVIGTPRGRPGVMTVGDVLASEASLPGLARDILIRISADVAPGTSGGPVLNARGQVVGLVIARAGDGTGLAVSAATILASLPALRQGARIERPWIGIAGRSLSPDPRDREFGALRGAVIQEVVPDSPAAAADLRPDDVIIALNGQRVESWEDLLRLVADREPGQRIRLTLIRAGLRLEVSVTLGVRP
ncbi:MAG: trypsin-like peptidase domain-containing protein [Armatimonadota bacterium]|nr:trypsin-like peptidase domain-containing protein [Armatimonadota bacterium]MDR7518432.1 trypsin-like peptidase domain-containing protein [Armatimonadota bacterium]MDR7550171.1 trypsin-like peptidase domain-containing protein [Armatimonadota bacterium]